MRRPAHAPVSLRPEYEAVVSSESPELVSQSRLYHSLYDHSLQFVLFSLSLPPWFWRAIYDIPKRPMRRYVSIGVILHIDLEIVTILIKILLQGIRVTKSFFSY